MNNPNDTFSRPLDAPTADPAAEAKVEAGKDHVSQAARDLKEAAMLKGAEIKTMASQKAGDVRKKVESSVHDVRAKAEFQTREEPVKALGIAFGVGFLLGLMIRR